MVHFTQKYALGPQSWHHTEALLSAQNTHVTGVLGNPNSAVKDDNRECRISVHASAALVLRCVCDSSERGSLLTRFGPVTSDNSSSEKLPVGSGEDILVEHGT